MFGDDLATGAAGGGSTGASDSKGGEVAVAVSEGFEDGDALGATAEAVTGTFNVGASDDSVVGGLQCGTC